LLYKFTHKDLEEPLFYDSDKDCCIYKNTERKFQYSKSNNHEYFEYKQRENGKIINRIWISKSKIEFAIEKDLSNLSDLEDYQSIMYDIEGNRFIIETLSEYQSFKVTKNKESLKDLDGEIWKPINEIQLVSNYGRTKNIFNKEINQKINKQGYCEIRTLNDGYLRVHKAVLMAFDPQPFLENPKLEPNHKDFNRQNNYFTNLEWTTKSENIKHSFTNPNRKDGKKLRSKSYKNDT